MSMKLESRALGLLGGNFIASACWFVVAAFLRPMGNLVRMSCSNSFSTISISMKGILAGSQWSDRGHVHECT